jgi:hypothetical protein
MSSGNTWPEKAELASTIQQMLKTVPVGMFAMARAATSTKSAFFMITACALQSRRRSMGCLASITP